MDGPFPLGRATLLLDAFQLGKKKINECRYLIHGRYLRQLSKEIDVASIVMRHKPLCRTFHWIVPTHGSSTETRRVLVLDWYDG